MPEILFVRTISTFVSDSSFVPNGSGCVTGRQDDGRLRGRLVGDGCHDHVLARRHAIESILTLIVRTAATHACDKQNPAPVRCELQLHQSHVDPFHRIAVGVEDTSRDRAADRQRDVDLLERFAGSDRHRLSMLEGALLPEFERQVSRFAGGNPVVAGWDVREFVPPIQICGY